MLAELQNRVTTASGLPRPDALRRPPAVPATAPITLPDAEPARASRPNLRLPAFATFAAACAFIGMGAAGEGLGLPVPGFVEGSGKTTVTAVLPEAAAVDARELRTLPRQSAVPAETAGRGSTSSGAGSAESSTEDRDGSGQGPSPGQPSSGEDAPEASPNVTLPVVGETPIPDPDVNVPVPDLPIEIPDVDPPATLPEPGSLPTLP